MEAGMREPGAKPVEELRSYDPPKIIGLGTIAELTHGVPNKPSPENGGGHSV